MNRKAIVAKSLVVWFVPCCFVLPQINGLGPVKVMLFLPLINGFPLAWLIAPQYLNGLIWPIAILISIALPVALVVLALRTSERRPVVLGVGFLVSCALSTVAYWWLRA